MQNRSIPFFVGSSDDLGATEVTAGRDSFNVQFKNPLNIPENAENITLELHTATIWWTVLNIKAGINDKFRFSDLEEYKTITISPGLYDVAALSAAINNGLINEGMKSDLIKLTGDSATQKVLATFSEAQCRIDWISDSFYELCGFTENQLVPAGGETTGPYSELAPNVAAFSDVSSFLVHTSLVSGSGGIPQGNKSFHLIASIPIAVPPGSQQIYQPYIPIRLDCPHMKGQVISNASFNVTDQLNRSLDFNTENWTSLFIIRYNIDPHKHRLTRLS